MAKLNWTEVDSSNVDAIAHDPASKTLAVRFKGGGLYTYDGVNHDEYANFVHAESIGKYLNNVIKVLYPYKKWSNEADVIHTLEEYGNE